MTFKDIKNGMIIQTRNGKHYVKIDGYFYSHDKYLDTVNYEVDLTHGISKDFDIMKVYSPVTLRQFTSDDYSDLDPIWERIETPSPLFIVGDIIKSDAGVGMVIAFDASEDEEDYNLYNILEVCDNENGEGIGETMMYCQNELISLNAQKIGHSNDAYRDFVDLIIYLRSLIALNGTT